MKVLYDHIVFEQQITGGVSRYFTELISSFSSDLDTELSVKFSNNIYLNKKCLVKTQPIIDYRQEFIKGIEFRGKGRLFKLVKSLNKSKYPDTHQTNLDSSIEALKRQDFDVFHPTSYNPYFLDYIRKKPFVITVHDMIHEIYPEFIHKDDHTSICKKKLVEKATHIIAVSENTKKDLMELLNVSEKKITVIYHGIPDVEESNTRRVPDNYILYVGDRHGYKNFLFFLYSVAELLREYNIKVICTGPEFNDIEKRKLIEFNIDKNVIHINSNEEELYNLYKHAIAFVFPSLYEGFGLPIIEAFACGCPVILSESSCFHEIAGKAALYFNPKRRTDICNKVKSVIEDDSLRSELISLGRLRKGSFSWAVAAEKTKGIYKSLL
jgi:glycosyltransferase involved in cell wall biosynthesis